MYLHTMRHNTLKRWAGSRFSPRGKLRRIITALMVLIAVFVLLPVRAQGNRGECEPTRSDAMGPYYEPGAPFRSKVGEGYVLTGIIRSSEDCESIPKAVVEIWMAGPDGDYSDEYRARLIADEEGNYRFESHVPVPYGGRPPHIHIRVTAPGHDPLVTQHYPVEESTQARTNLVLRVETQ